MNERSLRVLEFNKITTIVKNYAVSDLGKTELENLKPSSDFDVVRQMLTETNDTVSFIRRRGMPPIDGISNIVSYVKRAELGGTLNPLELIKICDNMKVARRLREHLSSDAITDTENTMETLVKTLYQNKRLEDKIKSCIISEDEISDSASHELLNIRRTISNLSSAIKDKLNDIIRSTKYQKFIQEPVVTMRGDRYVIPVKQEHRNDLPGLIHDASASGATIFIEPMAVVTINNNIKEARIKESKEIERILMELTADVLSVAETLHANVHILAKIDYLVAKGKYALDINAICPSLNKNKFINIISGRHPLIDPSVVVPVNFWIGEKFKTLVITGPNTGGKTVSLKTFGLFVLMTQAGLLIPAGEGSTMGIFSNVFSDIGDEQSIEQSLSTFSSHMKNIVSIVDTASSSELVLLDELGAGTDPQEGAALAISILEYLYKKDVLTVATTHYSELKAFALTQNGVENACCEFDVETLRPTYRLLIGIPGKSNAFSISKKLGLNEEILSRARESVSKEDIEFEDVLINIEKNLSQSQTERDEAKKILFEAQKIKINANEQLQKVKEKKENILSKANDTARSALNDALYEIEHLILELKENKKNLSHDQQLTESANIKKNIIERIKKANKRLVSEDDVDTDSDYELTNVNYSPKIGDNVIIRSMKQPATILTLPDRNNDLYVMAGIIKLNVNLTNIKLQNSDQTAQAHSDRTLSRFSTQKSKQIKTEIDLRGQTVDEAILELDKYIDDCAICGLKEARIIHGKGTGALRAGIHQYLKTNSHLSSYRIGKYGEGENGVTIIELK